MAIGQQSDFSIFPEQFHGGMFETLTQFTDAFNAGSRNCLRLVTRQHRGDYEEEAFVKSISTLVSRRDITSVSAATDLAVTQADELRIKLNRKIGPVAQTLNAWEKIGSTPEELSLRVGQQVGKAVAVDYLNNAIAAAQTTIGGVAALVEDDSAATITHAGLLDALAKRGDAAGDIVCWVMHSKVWFDLMKQAITDNIWTVGGTVIVEGTVGTINRPVVVTDSAALVAAGPVYSTLGLTEDAVTIMESEGQRIESDVVTGLEQLVGRIQGEYAYSVGAKGFAFDGATVNPTDAALATGGNWTRVASADDKLLGGVMLDTL
jgi:hypothetical protein